jgi:hypothetical protein
VKISDKGADQLARMAELEARAAGVSGLIAACSSISWSAT